jgi:hypothetical protein
LDFGEILELILGNNFLEINGTFYKQESGLAQGSKCSLEIADMYLPSLERIFVDQIPKLIMYPRNKVPTRLFTLRTLFLTAISRRS